MSTRRSTRAGSRAASSVNGVYAVGPEDIPSRTPGRGRPKKSGGSTAGSERGSASLPSMAATNSTSYGTNTLALPNYSPRGAPLANDISTVIEGLLEPEPVRKGSRLRPDSPQEPVPDVDAPAFRPLPGAPALTPSMRSRSGPVKRRVPYQGVERTFHNESHVFDNASIISSSFQQDDDDFPSFSAPPLDAGEARRRSAFKEIAIQEQYMRGGAPDGILADLGDNNAVNFRQFVQQPFYFVKESLKSNFTSLGKLFSFLLLVGLVSFIAWIAYMNTGGPAKHYYGSDMRANFGQFIPAQIKHPSRIFAPEDLKDVYRRLDIAEAEINFLKHRSTIDKNALEEIQKVLPDFVALDRDSHGKPTLPATLWHAMREKIRADPSLIPKPVQSPLEGSPSSSIKSETRDQEVFSSKEFDRYLESNRVKIQSWAGSEYDVLHEGRLQQLIKDGKVATKENVVELIKKSWKDSAQEVRSELQKLTRELEEKVANLGKQTLTAAEVKELANEVVRAQIEAISQTNINKKIGQSIYRTDHFAKRSHSAVVPRFTTPSYRFPNMDFGFIHRSIAYFFNHPIPLPNPADTALTSWDEIGDCWCSPQKNGDGPTLGVLTGYKVWPDQVVVEHYPQSGYKNSGFSPQSAPRQMQLLAYIRDKPTFLKVQAQSKNVFDKNENDDVENGWVQLAEWTYDAYGPVNQAFPVQIDLKNFITESEGNIKKDPSASNKFMIRVKNNHGHGNTPYTCIYRVRLHGDVKTDDET